MSQTRQPFQFNLRTIFIANIVFAFLAGTIRTLMSSDGEAVVFAPAAWLLGVMGVVTLAAIGDAGGREIGTIVGIVLGSIIWAIVFLLSWRWDPLMPENIGATVTHGIAIVVTAALMIWSAIHRILYENSDDEHYVEATQHLLDNQRQRHAKQPHEHDASS